MSHTYRRALGTCLATTFALGATVAPGALAEPIDLRTLDARDARAATPESSAAPQWPAHPKALGLNASATSSDGVRGSTSSGFDWGDAAIGAGAGLTLLCVGAGGTLVVRRARRARGAPAPHASR